MEITVVTFPILLAVVIGLDELAKKLGLPTRWAPALSLVLGIACGLIFFIDKGVPIAALNGVVLGLSASGLYSGLKATANK